MPLRVRRSYRGANPWARAQGRALGGGPGRRGALGRDELRRDSRQAFLGQVIFRNVMAREDSESEEETAGIQGRGERNELLSRALDREVSSKQSL